MRRRLDAQPLDGPDVQADASTLKRNGPFTLWASLCARRCRKKRTGSRSRRCGRPGASTSRVSWNGSCTSRGLPSRMPSSNARSASGPSRVPGAGASASSPRGPEDDAEDVLRPRVLARTSVTCVRHFAGWLHSVCVQAPRQHHGGARTSHAHHGGRDSCRHSHHR